MVGNKKSLLHKYICEYIGHLQNWSMLKHPQTFTFAIISQFLVCVSYPQYSTNMLLINDKSCKKCRTL